MMSSTSGRAESGASASSSAGSRRGVLLSLISASVLLTRPSAVGAAEEVKLPKEYRQLVKRLSEGLSESIETEASGASEAEVRRAADPAKEVVREFVRKWRDNPRISSDITHAEIKEALAELGEFYLAYGQRTKLTPPVRESVLRHLKAARSALPEEEGGSGKVLGLF
ncbi:hypothetical protein HYH02_011982 [Chlamydomonas schloesseri]|uniref:Uncharacterized protein n=1 Tax=Chlamydomonas schloesseri TaxID=2026947 RepID=A0A835W2L7_9CHLO|nr:hypothetical protein HYH02_011982 [Chlamydomonas schloesseri]|eukprot:KAG2434983.1 hypothetical protein HYH02_011982 [Chlamydomonas schloesseri]